jgi:hypothetical protein
MSEKKHFRELAIEQAPKQAVMVDAVTEDAPILAMIPMEAASNGFQNVYEEIKDIQGAQFVALDEELPDIGMDAELQYVDLSVLGGKQFVGEDKALKMGGAPAYFAKKLPSVLRETGAATETSILYNNIRAYAKANGKLLDAGGTASGSMFSMLCVKWVAGETTGLYDATGFGNGKVFDMAPINGGNLYENSDGRLGYGQRIKNYLGIQLANDRYVSGIANIDLTPNGSNASGFENLPTEQQIDEMLLQARASSGNTFIYCHPRVLNALNVYKGDKLQMPVVEGNMNRLIAFWNDIMFVTSWNFLETEATEVI